MKTKIKFYSLLGVIVSILIALGLTNLIGRCSVDKSTVEEVIQNNEVTQVRDSLESLYMNEKIALCDSFERKMLLTINRSNQTISDLKNDLKAERNTVLDLKNKYEKNPTLDNCNDVVSQQDKIIDDQYTAIDSLDKESQRWCVLYYNENESGKLKDTLLAKKERTIIDIQQQFNAVSGQLKIVDEKLQSAGWFKRNWLWVTNSYRNWLKNR